MFETDLDQIRTEYGPHLEKGLKVDGGSYIYGEIPEQNFESAARLDARILFDEVKKDQPIQTPGYALPTLTRQIIEEAAQRFDID